MILLKGTPKPCCLEISGLARGRRVKEDLWSRVYGLGVVDLVQSQQDWQRFLRRTAHASRNPHRKRTPRPQGHKIPSLEAGLMVRGTGLKAVKTESIGPKFMMHRISGQACLYVP